MSEEPYINVPAEVSADILVVGAVISLALRRVSFAVLILGAVRITAFVYEAKLFGVLTLREYPTTRTT